MSCPPPAPIDNNPVALAQTAAAFGAGPTCEAKGGTGGFSFLFGLFKVDSGAKNSKGCSAISKQLSYLSQANSISACQLQRSASSSTQQSVVINTIDFINGPGAQTLCGPGGFNVSNITKINFQLSVKLDSTATQSIAETANVLIQNLLAAKVESNQGYLAVSDGLQLYQAAISDTKNYIQTTNVNDTYIDMFQSTDTTNIIRITNYGIITGDSCNITNSNMNYLTGSQLIQTLANQSASLKSVVDFNNSFDAFVNDNTAGKEALSDGAIAGIVIGVCAILAIIITVAIVCKDGGCAKKNPDAKQGGVQIEMTTFNGPKPAAESASAKPPP